MTLPPIPAIAAVLFCAALFVLLFQYLFPRPAPWRLVGAAVVAGGVCTYVLSLILRHLVGTGPARFDDLTTIPAAFTFAILHVGLPEELTKAWPPCSRWRRSGAACRRRRRSRPRSVAPSDSRSSRTRAMRPRSASTPC